MFEREAHWHARCLAGHDPETISPLLNIGSSDRHFREQTQPWLERIIFAPLRARGIRVIHCDVRAGDGIDLQADILTGDGLRAASATRPRAVLCSNVLEHVPDPRQFAERCQAIVRPGGLLVVTVPRSYPHHRDPVDTMFRPTPEEIAALFPGCAVLRAEILPMGYYWQQIRERPLIVFRHVFRLPVPFLGWQKWQRSMRKLYWLVRPYRQSCVILRKPLKTGD